jgi:uncharacterized membrane protein YqhA
MTVSQPSTHVLGNTGVLKVKLATALIGISSIHLLQTFINASRLEQQ